MRCGSESGSARVMVPRHEECGVAQGRQGPGAAKEVLVLVLGTEYSKTPSKGMLREHLPTMTSDDEPRAAWA